MAIYCSWCHEETTGGSCGSCGRDPLLNGEWRLVSSIGHGATGQTWRAESGDDVVAIKELSFRRIADLKQLELFEREAGVLQSLDHPGIPTYLDDFLVEADKHMSLYLVQEYIDGAALDERSVSSEPEIIEVMQQIAEILVYLTDRRPPVVHRDIKPSNIMRRTSDGSYVLIDFGSTRAAVGATGNTVAGTLGYMAPEQLMGRAMPASDIYGLGATAVALLAGEDASSLINTYKPGAWRKRVTVSKGLGNLIDRMLLVEPDERPSAKELPGLLKQLTEDALPAVRPAKAISEQKRTHEKLPGPDHVRRMVADAVSEFRLVRTDKGKPDITTWRGSLIEVGRKGVFENLVLLPFPGVVPPLVYVTIDMIYFQFAGTHLGFPGPFLLGLWAVIFLLFLPVLVSVGRALDVQPDRALLTSEPPKRIGSAPQSVERFQAEVHVVDAEQLFERLVLLDFDDGLSCSATIEAPIGLVAGIKKNASYFAVVRLKGIRVVEQGEAFDVLFQNVVVGHGVVSKIYF